MYFKIFYQSGHFQGHRKNTTLLKIIVLNHRIKKCIELEGTDKYWAGPAQHHCQEMNYNKLKSN